MKIKPYFPNKDQVIFHVFNIKTCIKSVWIKDPKIYLPAPESDMPFNPLECFVFDRNPFAIVEKARRFLFETSSLVDGSGRVKPTERLLEYLPNPLMETINMVLKMSQFEPEPVPDHLELTSIFVLHMMELPFVAQVKAGRLFTWADDPEAKDSLKDPKEHLPPPPLSKPVIEIPRDFKIAVVPTHKDKATKPDRRKKRKTPKDVLKYYEHLAPKSNWRFTLKAMYNQSRYGKITDNKYYQGTYPNKGRWYTYGVDRLAEVTAQGEKTVRRHLTLMREHKLIRRIKRGYPGQGNAIYELPLDLKHIMAWKKHPQTRRKRKW